MFKKEPHPTNHESDQSSVRLNKFLASCGLGSRRACDELIVSGRICINGKKVSTLGIQINPERDVIEYKGKMLKGVKPLRYMAYHKSRGSIVTAHDPQGRETIYDALEKSGCHGVDGLRYIGRLDRNSEGLLLLTNDGALIHGLTHPRFKVKKVYDVKTDAPVSPEDIHRMCTDGVESEGETLRASQIRRQDREGEIWYEVVLFEGRNRQIRRMFAACGRDVIRLRRIQFGVVKLRGLRRNGWRDLLPQEVHGLSKAGYQNSGTPKKRRP